MLLSKNQNTELFVSCGFMGFLIFSGGKKLCIFKVFFTDMKARATVIFKLKWRSSWNHCIPAPWMSSEIAYVRNPLMERNEWAIMCGVIFYPLFYLYLLLSLDLFHPLDMWFRSFLQAAWAPYCTLTTHISSKRAS